MGFSSLWSWAQKTYVPKLTMENLAYFRSRYLALRFTYSRQRTFYREGCTLQMLLVDALDIHLFTQDARFTNRTGFNALVKDRGEHDYRDCARCVRQALTAIRPMPVQEKQDAIAFAKSRGDEIGAPVVTTEAGGPWWHMDHRDLNWRWLKDWCEQSMNLAGQSGFWRYAMELLPSLPEELVGNRLVWRVNDRLKS